MQVGAEVTRPIRALPHGIGWKDTSGGLAPPTRTFNLPDSLIPSPETRLCVWRTGGAEVRLHTPEKVTHDPGLQYTRSLYACYYYDSHWVIHFGAVQSNVLILYSPALSVGEGFEKLKLAPVCMHATNMTKGSSASTLWCCTKQCANFVLKSTECLPIGCVYLLARPPYFLPYLPQTWSTQVGSWADLAENNGPAGVNFTQKSLTFTKYIVFEITVILF